MTGVLMACCAVVAAQAQQTIYVDDDASVGGNGSSWPTAFKYLQDALVHASSGDEIHVAQGTYKPDRDEGGNVTLGDREASFQLISGVALRGGYAGIREPNPNLRNIGLYETILSGDLKGDDGPTFTNYDENSYHVVRGDRVDKTAILDGFTITAGNADGSAGTKYAGGGVHCRAELAESNPTISNCRITANAADAFGGGLYLQESTSSITNCVIAGNITRDTGVYRGLGGGVCCTHASGIVSMAKCTITGNTANRGAGVYCDSARLRMASCTIAGNTAHYSGGAVYSDMAAGHLIAGCLINGNSAKWYGGGIYYRRYNPTIVNCTITGNTATWYGGGSYFHDNCHPTISNTILSANSADYGPEIAIEDGSYAAFLYSDLHGGESRIWVSGGSLVVWGSGTIFSDPAFVDPKNGNFRLQFNSPCVDAGSNDMLPPDEWDLDGDGNLTEPIPYDLSDSFRVGRFTVDMGTYEIPFADLNCDRVVDFDDIDPFVLAMSGQAAYLAQYPDCEWLNADCNGDGTVNFDDIDPFVALLGG